MNPLAAIHVGKAQLGLDDETYRDLLSRLTGKRSAKEMSPAERDVVLAEMRRLGFEPTRPRRRQPPPQPSPASGGGRRLQADGPYAGKLQALWIAAWNLGITRSRDDAAMIAFVERQTGIAHTRWLRDPADLRKVVEALKGWIAREGGVEWPPTGAGGHRNDLRYRIVVAQWRRLAALGAVRPEPAATDPDDLSMLEHRYAARVTGKSAFPFYGDADWIGLMNALGRKLRAALARKPQGATE